MLSNQRITEIKEIVSPDVLTSKYMPTQEDTAFILKSRATIEEILVKQDSRLMVIVGPCSIHDVDAAIEYARFLQSLQDTVPRLFLVMRVYFEKPRSRLGWKGLIYDPDLDESFQINKGLEIARRLLLTLTQMRIPIGCEFLDTLTPQYLSDLVSWGAIGARTSESQIHRQLASGLSMPIGFKNLTSGDYDKAIDGIHSAAYPHHFLGVNDQGQVSHVQTKGNPFGHLILRGGDLPNYDEPTIRKVAATLAKEKLRTGIVVDCSHGNSQKDHNRQLLVALHVVRQRKKQQTPSICGIMLESNLLSGKQALSKTLRRGVSITDACIDIPTTRILLQMLQAPVSPPIHSIADVRRLIHACDTCIHANTIDGFPPSIIPSKILLEEDKEVVELCRSQPNSESLMMMIALRLGLSERIAEYKLAESPFAYMRKQNDFLPLITRRDIESNILRLFPNTIFLKIMELSKRIQVRCLELLTQETRIGYLFGPGTFSHEVVLQFRGLHRPYPSYTELLGALQKNEIDYMILPSYNSIIGEIYGTPASCVVQGTLEHSIDLAVYSNSANTDTNTIPENLYVEPHILKECHAYIQKIDRTHTILTKNSMEGCIACIQDKERGISSRTISSKRNQSNFLTTIATDIVPHNVTTFSFVSRVHPHDHPVESDTSSPLMPESLELLCHI